MTDAGQPDGGRPMRPCNRRATRRSRLGRMLDRVRYGHARHMCTEDRPGFMLNHAGPHRCTCGVQWPVEPVDAVSADDPNWSPQVQPIIPGPDFERTPAADLETQDPPQMDMTMVIPGNPGEYMPCCARCRRGTKALPGPCGYDLACPNNCHRVHLIPKTLDDQIKPRAAQARKDH